MSKWNDHTINRGRQLINHYPEAKVIIVTKHVDAETRQAAKEVGARFLVSKDDLLSLRALILASRAED